MRNLDVRAMQKERHEKELADIDVCTKIIETYLLKNEISFEQLLTGRFNNMTYKRRLLFYVLYKEYSPEIARAYFDFTKPSECRAIRTIEALRKSESKYIVNDHIEEIKSLAKL